MTTPDAERIVQSVLQEANQRSDEGAQSRIAAITATERTATEVTRLEAARRERIELESIEKIAAAQRKTERQGQHAERYLPPRPQEVGPTNRVDRTAVSEKSRDKDPAQQAFIALRAVGRDETASRASDQVSRESAQQKSPLEVQVKAKRELIVKLEDDSQALIDSVVKQVEILLDERDQVILQQVEQRLSDSQSRRQNALNFST